MGETGACEDDGDGDLVGAGLPSPVNGDGAKKISSITKKISLAL